MSDEPSTLLGAGESLNKGQAVDLLLNTNAPEEASEDTQEPVAEVEEVVETDEMEATSEDEFEAEDAEELSEADEEYEDDDEEYDVDESEVEEVLDEESYYTVKVDGEEKNVSADELVKSYQLEQAAQKRMQEAAEVRKTSEAEAQALFDASRSEQGLNLTQKIRLQAQFPELAEKIKRETAVAAPAEADQRAWAQQAAQEEQQVRAASVARGMAATRRRF